VSFKKIAIEGLDDFIRDSEKHDRMLTGYCFNSVTFHSFLLLISVINVTWC